MILHHADCTDGFDDEILSLNTDPLWFTTSEAYIEFAHPTDLVRKATFLRLTSDPEEEARKRFFQAEQMCFDTNRRLSTNYNPDGRLGELIHRVRKNIASLLPKVDRSLCERIFERGGWGSGSTSSTKGSWVSFFHKLKADQHATPALLPIASAFISETEGWNGVLEPRTYNKVSFVPKNAKTHRAIAVEPSMNAYIQRGVGVMFRALLRNWGVNLHSQEKNAELARLGSIDGSFATIDLSMASDTISFKVIDYLFPSEWRWLLEILRTPAFLDPEDGKTIRRYEKFSSMGNGYTFELETLIFSAIVRSVVSRGDEWAVYGDDIAVPTYAVGEVADLLSHLGFLVNEEKSFISGPFRESCGKDFFLGDEVRGFYLKEIKPETPFVWANWLRLSSRLPYKKTWWRIVKQCWHFRAFVPYGNHGLLGFFTDPTDLGLDNWIFENRPYGPVIGFRFSGWSFTPRKLDLSQEFPISMVIANLRSLVAKRTIDQPPFAVTAREEGTWRRRTSVFYEDVKWLRPI